MLDAAQTASPLLVHSFLQMEILLSTLDFLPFEAVILLHSVSRADSPLLVFGLGHPDFVFSLSVLKTASPDTSLLAQSFACLGSSLVASSFGHFDLLLFIRSVLRGESTAPLFGLACSEPVSSPLVPDVACFASPLLVQSCAHLGSLVFVMDFSHLGFLLPLQAPAQLEPAFSLARHSLLELSLLILDSSHVGFVVALKQLVWSSATKGCMMYIYICICICIYVSCIYACIYIYIHTYIRLAEHSLEISFVAHIFLLLCGVVLPRSRV